MSLGSIIRSSTVSTFNLHFQLSCKLASSIIRFQSCITVNHYFEWYIVWDPLRKLPGLASTYHLSTCLRPIYIADTRQTLEIFLGAVDGVHCVLLVWGTVILQIELRFQIRRVILHLLASLSLTTWGRSLYSNFLAEIASSVPCRVFLSSLNASGRRKTS